MTWLSGRFERSGDTCRWIEGFKRQAESRRQPRRAVYKAEVNAEGTNRRFVLTNLPGPPAQVYALYCDRGTAETLIDDFKKAVRADRLSCHRFAANALRLVLAAFPHSLLRPYRARY